MSSIRPTPQQLVLDFDNEAGPPDATPELQPEQSSSADMEKPALNPVSLDLMERIVDVGNMERRGRKSKRTAEPRAPMVSRWRFSSRPFAPNGRKFDDNSWKGLTDRAPPDGKPFPNRMAASEISAFQT